jgi:hypothetical protein
MFAKTMWRRAVPLTFIDHVAWPFVLAEKTTQSMWTRLALQTMFPEGV